MPKASPKVFSGQFSNAVLSTPLFDSFSHRSLCSYLDDAAEAWIAPAERIAELSELKVTAVKPLQDAGFELLRLRRGSFALFSKGINEFLCRRAKVPIRTKTAMETRIRFEFSGRHLFSHLPHFLLRLSELQIGAGGGNDAVVFEIVESQAVRFIVPGLPGGDRINGKL